MFFKGVPDRVELACLAGLSVAMISGCSSGGPKPSVSPNAAPIDPMVGGKPTPQLGTQSNVSGASNGSTSSSAPFTLSEEDLHNDKAAEVAQKTPDPSLAGKYQVVIDETVFPAAVRRNPKYPEKLAEARSKAPYMEFSPDGTVKAKLATGPTSGFLTVIKGYQTVVLKSPDKKYKFLTLPIKVYDNGGDFIVDIPEAKSKPLYKKVSDPNSPVR